nr:DUF5985 family protein [uncultured Pseudoxanthomonas sp.]
MSSPLLTGAIVLASALVALHFLRFWKSTRDGFFLYFALSFAIQAAQWLHSGVYTGTSEYSPVYYLVRLLAYGLIAYAILRRNFGRATPPVAER